jgi:hypothetical protein
MVRDKKNTIKRDLVGQEYFEVPNTKSFRKEK